jgi:hypothetical protein
VFKLFYERRIKMASVKYKHLVFTLCFTAVFLFVVQAFAQTGSRDYKPSPSDCDAYARNKAENSSEGVLSGAIKGTARGALFGAIVGDRKGAKKGAALGGVVRGTKSAVNRDKIRRQAYDDCMAGRVQW